MKAAVTVRFVVETDDYEGVPPTLAGAEELAHAMVSREADIPDDYWVMARPATDIDAALVVKASCEQMPIRVKVRDTIDASNISKPQRP